MHLNHLIFQHIHQNALFLAGTPIYNQPKLTKGDHDNEKLKVKVTSRVQYIDLWTLDFMSQFWNMLASINTDMCACIVNYFNEILP